jgi:chromate transporter
MLAPETDHVEKSSPLAGSAGEVFLTFLKLGLTSFGGPIAHLGYFHRELVERRHWIDEARYAQLMALCQFLPGPASSQMGFALGLIRAGWRGALAAFIAFTLPSALLLFAFAQLLPVLSDPYGQAAIHGLKLVAVAVVAQGVLGMAQRLTPDAPRALIAAAAGGVVAISGSAVAQILVVAIGAVLGLVFCRHVAGISGPSFALRYGLRVAAVFLIVFALLLAAALWPQDSASPLAAAAAAFYRAGALVFGGGHVVLPLLQEAVVAPGWVSADDFLAGYGAAQAVPGPMFSLAAFLGARLDGAHGGMLGASVSTLAIFLPGFLLIAGALPLWRSIQNRASAASALAGINAAVVGLLAAALYDPVWTSAVITPVDFAIALIGFALLVATRVSVLAVLAWCVLASITRAWLQA